MLNYPILFRPIYKNYLWGGGRIANVFNRQTPFLQVAESWELTDRQEGVGIVENGPAKGKSLNDLVVEDAQALVGKRVERFPLLIKIIDATKTLSVQVHPNIECAKKWGGDPKSEGWYAFASDNDAGVYVGFNRKVTKEELKKLAEDGGLEDILHYYPLHKGDVFYIPAGTVHAITGGAFVFEVQNNSNTTYRLYDWNRLDKEGEPRPLQLEKAIEALNFDDITPFFLHHFEKKKMEEGFIEELLTTGDFVLDRCTIYADYTYKKSEKTFESLFIMEGKGSLSLDDNEESIILGRSYFLPACGKEVKIKVEEPLIFLRVALER